MKPTRIAKSTEYFKLSSDENQTIGVSHHKNGLGKLKIMDKESGTEYGIPLTDVINEPLSAWRIDKK